MWKKLSVIFAMMLVVNCVFAANLYISPNGNDSNSGEDSQHSLKSLKRALMMAYNGKHQNGEMITIRVGPGVYQRDSTRITLPNDIPAVEILGPSEKNQYAVFTNGPKNQAWITLMADKAQELNLSISRIEVRNYFSVLALLGNRDDPNKGNSKVIVHDNIFRSIGSTPSTSTGPIATGVIRLINSSHNIIENNDFLNIYNSKGCDALHSIYLAHFSSGNVIRNNRFNKACGASIRLRDRANNNKITDNHFENLKNVPAVQEWFCDKDGRSGCTKGPGECPSVDNLVEKNTILPRTAKSQYIVTLGGTKPRAWCSTSLFMQKRIR